jgi:hypothetical protein
MRFRDSRNFPSSGVKFETTCPTGHFLALSREAAAR